MTEEKRPALETGYDNEDPRLSKRMEIGIDLEALRDNPNGTMLLRGFFEERKRDALFIIQKQREMKAKPKSNLIVPGLKVH